MLTVLMAINVKYSWLFGVLLATLASIISNLGLTLQKLTHQRQALGIAREDIPYYRHGIWQVGLSFVIIGSAADFVALSFAPQSLVAPLGALTMVSNVIFAPLILREHVTTKDLIATFIILSGSVLAVAFGAHVEYSYQIQELYDSFFYWPFAIYATLIVIILFITLHKLHVWEDLETEHILHDGPPLSDTSKQLQRFGYPFSAGLVGAQSVLFAKCFVELIIVTWKGQGNAFKHYQTFVILFFLMLTIFLQVRFLNDGLARYDTSYIVPVFVSIWIILSVVGGLVFFEEYRGMSKTQLGVFSLGVLITVVGVFLLSLRPFESSLQNLPVRGGGLFGRDIKGDNDAHSRADGEDDEDEDDKDEIVARRNSKKPLLGNNNSSNNSNSNNNNTNSSNGTNTNGSSESSQTTDNTLP